MDPQKQARQEEGEKRKKTQRSFLCKVNAQQCKTLLQLVQGTFKMPRSKQTQLQKNAVRKYQRRKSDFHVVSGMLYFQGKKVLTTSHAAQAVNRTFTRNLGSGSRSTWMQMKIMRAGVSFAQVKQVLGKSRHYQIHHPLFRNKVPPKSVVSSQVNERWQIDLIDMHQDQVLYKGKAQRYILSIIDIFSRFILLRPLARKTSANVAKTLKRVFAEHGMPKIIQCDQGSEFKGRVNRLLQRTDINVIRSRPYHPQSQGKCERSHREVRSKIIFKTRQQEGFNWARNLFQIQEVINRIPKEVLGNRSPSEVYTHRGNMSLCEEVKKAAQRSNQQKTKGICRRIRTSTYRKGEKVLIRYPTKGGSKRIPRRRYICKGVVEERNFAQNKYKVKFQRPDGQNDSQWILVSDITSVTSEKEKRAAKRSLTEELKKDLHRHKYYITLTHRDRIELLKSSKIKILHDPSQSVGSCQFEAVSHQLSLFGIYKTPQNLRQEAVADIQQFPALYNDFIIGNTTTYVNSMRKESTYGDHLTLLALSRTYNIQFLIASADGPQYNTFISPDDKYSEQVFLLTLGYFPEDKGAHYVSIAIENQKKRELLASALNEGQPLDRVESEEPTHSVDSEVHDPTRPVDSEYEETTRPMGSEFEEPTRLVDSEFEEPTRPVDSEVQEPTRPVDSEFEEPTRPVDSEYEETTRPMDSEFEEPTRPVDSEFEETTRHVNSAFEEPTRPVDSECEDVDGMANLGSSSFHISYDVLLYVLTLCVSTDVSSISRLKMVCRAFKYGIEKVAVPNPEIHLSPNVEKQLKLYKTYSQSQIVSVRRLINTCGSYSGLVLAVRARFQHPRWHLAWLVLRRARRRGFFEIVKVYWRK